MVSETATKMFLFTATFALMFGILGMAFTTFTEIEVPTGGLSKEELLRAGIILTESVSWNVTKDGPRVNYALHEYDVGVRWGWTYPTWFEYRRESTLIGWVAPQMVYVEHPIKEHTDISWDRYDREDWIVEEFDPSYNWTHRTASTIRRLGISGPDAIEIFYTITPGFSSMQECMDNGKVTITIGRGMGEDPSWVSFIGWYIGMSFPTNTYGFPWYLSIVLLFMNIMIVVSLYQMIRG